MIPFDVLQIKLSFFLMYSHVHCSVYTRQQKKKQKRRAFTEVFFTIHSQNWRLNVQFITKIHTTYIYNTYLRSKQRINKIRLPFIHISLFPSLSVAFRRLRVVTPCMQTNYNQLLWPAKYFIRLNEWANFPTIFTVAFVLSAWASIDNTGFILFFVIISDFFFIIYIFMCVRCRWS